MAEPRCSRGVLAGLVLGLVLVDGAQARAEGSGQRASLLAPPLQRDVTRVSGVLRLFPIVPGPGLATVSEVGIEHYFRVPLKLGLDVRPLALAVQGGSAGLISHVRGLCAYAGDYVEVGVALGAQLQHFGASGVALGATLRLGSLDGLNLLFENGYALVQGYYTGAKEFALDHFLGEINVPLSRRFTLNLSGGFGLDLWFYGTLGLRHYLRGQGGRGTAVLYGAVGGAGVVDRFRCQYQDPAPCESSVRAYGPTIAAGMDVRF